MNDDEFLNGFIDRATAWLLSHPALVLAAAAVFVVWLLAVGVGNAPRRRPPRNPATRIGGRR